MRHGTGKECGRILRLLCVEDSEERVERLKEWLPTDVRFVWARNGGQALGILQKDRGRVYAGILLDHDLQQRVVTVGGERVTGTDVVAALRQLADRDTPILVHSNNRSEGDAMAARLEAAGFPVTRAPWSDLTAARFQEWLEEVREEWEEGREDE